MELDAKEKKQEFFNIYQYDAELALAFQSDCENFLQKFSNLRSFSFAQFSELWKETCFISVFEGQDFILMLQTFLENCFFVVKKFLFSTDIYIQVGALYLLYALYYKQPVKEWVKIRLTQIEADKLNEIVEFQKRNGSWEVVFIHSKMRLAGAFQYCALIQALGLEAKYLKRYDLSGEEISRASVNSVLKKFKKLVEEDSCLTDLQKTDEEYQSLVNKYKEKCKKLHVFPSTIRNNLKRAYNNIFEISASQQEDSSENEQDRLKDIKSRAMRNNNATYRAERSMVTGVDYDDFEADVKVFSSR